MKKRTDNHGTKVNIKKKNTYKVEGNWMLNFLKEERSDWDKTQSSDCATTVKQSFLFLCHIYRQGCGVVGATGFG